MLGYQGLALYRLSLDIKIVWLLYCNTIASLVARSQAKVDQGCT